MRVTFAVCDGDCVDTGHVENGEGDGGGQYNAVVSMVMAEVKDGTKVFEGYSRKMGSSPLVKQIDSCTVQLQRWTWLTWNLWKGSRWWNDRRHSQQKRDSVKQSVQRNVA